MMSQGENIMRDDNADLNATPTSKLNDNDALSWNYEERNEQNGDNQDLHGVDIRAMNENLECEKSTYVNYNVKDDIDANNKAKDE